MNGFFAVSMRSLRSTGLAFVAPLIGACVGLATLGALSDGAQAQTVTEFRTGITLNTLPEHITTGPDGNLWFTESTQNRTQTFVGRLSTSV